MYFHAIVLELVITESILAIYRHLAPRSFNQEAKNAIMVERLKIVFKGIM
jgi:hypothetical protein